jgi:hypothetical protein
MGTRSTAPLPALCNPSIKDVFHDHLAHSSFPGTHAQQIAHNENVKEDSDDDDPHIRLTSARPMEIDDLLRQDDYQQVMH